MGVDDKLSVLLESAKSSIINCMCMTVVCCSLSINPGGEV